MTLKRELEEELGIRDIKYKKVDTIKFPYNNYIFNVFYSNTIVDINLLKLQPDEVIQVKWYSKEDIYFDCIAIENPDIVKLFNIPSKVEYINEPICGQWTGYSYYIALYDEKHHLIYEINRYRKILDPTTNEPDNTYQISYNNLFIFYLADRMGLVR